MRRLNPNEEAKLESLTRHGISLTLIQVTKTGLEKSILDATYQVRLFLQENGIHDYTTQEKGPKAKVQIETSLFGPDDSTDTTTSLYRPRTKNGDPRLWISKLRDYANPDDIVAIGVLHERLIAFNLTSCEISSILEGRAVSVLGDVLIEMRSISLGPSQELLAKLRRLAQQGVIPSVMGFNADTAIGRTLETHLGIKINSRKSPDYKGIEIKSFRKRRWSNRITLFAKVPNWELSTLKSSAEILETFGSWRGDEFKLYCTVTANKPNQQGLYLFVNTNLDQLDERWVGDEEQHAVTWLLSDLRNTLRVKHNETFWVAADEVQVGDSTGFLFTHVEHTRKPILSQFELLIEQGKISLDHAIKLRPSGGVTEKGPLFRIDKAALSLLFPPSKVYSLRDG